MKGKRAKHNRLAWRVNSESNNKKPGANPPSGSAANKRDARAAKRFFRKMLKAPKRQSPLVINVDRSNPYPPAVEELKKKCMFPVASRLRQRRYLDTLIEKGDRFIKRRVNPGLGFSSFNTARRTISGYEAMNVIKKGQIEGVGKGAIQGQVKFAWH
jgi:transposase-like protein